ncbi:MAG: hypothetical protein WB919_17605 [Candidatus Sulfotelmatobacter sp.]
MKALTLALLLTISLSTTTFSMSIAPPTQQQADRRPTGQIQQAHAKTGQWYFAASGHAVYCYGPVMTLPQANGDLQKVATFCRDGQAVVPLKD